MKAIGVRAHGGPDALEVLAVPVPPVGPGQVRIRVGAATVNPADTLVRDGRLTRWQAVQLPAVPGMEAAGEVDAVGEGTDTDLTVGTPVIAVVMPSGTNGAYAEYVTVPAGSVVRAPAGVDLVHAATLPMAGLTAHHALDVLAPAPDATVGVTGAGGVLGGYVVQLAKRAGLRVVADASEADRDFVRSLGADVVVPWGDDVGRSIRAAVPGGVDVLTDGSTQGDAVLAGVRDGGRIATLRGYRGEPERGITWHAVGVDAVAEDRRRLTELRDLVEAGTLQLPEIAEVYPAERASESHARLEQGPVRGRMVLTF